MNTSNRFPAFCSAVAAHFLNDLKTASNRYANGLVLIVHGCLICPIQSHCSEAFNNVNCPQPSCQATGAISGAGKVWHLAHLPPVHDLSRTATEKYSRFPWAYQ
eukprot:2039880-Amphidinium_carterae.1